MKSAANVLVIVGVVLILVFVYQSMSHEKAQQQALAEANSRIQEQLDKQQQQRQQQEQQAQQQQLEQELREQQEAIIAAFQAEQNEAFATLEIPKLKKTLPIVEGVEPDDLDKGVGHIPKTVYPGQGEQIVLSGHRDTVFRGFKEMKIGDEFIVTMPYGTYTYEIRETEIVPEDDTTVIRSMGEEVLVVTTCYPFYYIGNAPDRFVYYAYPKKSEPDAHDAGV